MDMKKIEELAKTPRTNLDEIAKIYSKPLFSILRKQAVADWEKSASVAPLIFLTVVQANEVLYEKGEETFSGAVLAYSPDSKKCRDSKWLLELASKVAAVRDMKNVSAELKSIQDYLNDTENMFGGTLKLPDSLTGGVEAYIDAVSIDRVDNVEGEVLKDDSVLVGLYVNDNGYEHYTPIAPVKLFK